jgi:CheY-like chemotaxis protein/anti-sigma regulatory factor (Ser/Thr protein kinase)
MSHEIRTPLTAVLGFVELLKEPALGEEERLKYLEVIERTGRSLATIINDILDISKVEAGKLQIEKSVCSPGSLIGDLDTLLRLRAEEKGIRLLISSAKLPEWLVTDPMRLKQILINVIGNAIKFTNRGEVAVHFEARDGRLVCTVTDTGVGIPSETMDLLFQPFTQIESAPDKRFGGTGLGLVLSRRLAQLLGGDVRLERSEAGVGSTFVVTVAFESARHPAARTLKPPTAVAALGGKRILIVEDSPDNQFLTKQYLLKTGAEADVVNDGLEALEAIEAKDYDLVLMDMQMPVMDGYAATGELRRRGFRTPIVALTAHAMKDDLERCLDAGCDGYLAKPFRRCALIETIVRHCRPGFRAGLKLKPS